MRKIVMPSAGKSGGPITIRKWFKEPGDSVHKGEVIVQVENIDGLIELDAANEGVILRVIVPAGKTVEAGTEIAEIEESANANSHSAPATPSVAVPVAQAAKTIAAKAPKSVVISVLMPAVSNTMEEGTIVRWLVKEGDRIKVGQEIFETETDKATVTVEATDAGRLAKIIAGAGAVVLVKGTVAYLAENDSDVEGLGTETSPANSAPANSSASPSSLSAGSNDAASEPLPADAIAVLMPAVSNTMEEGTIVRWMVKEGDRIKVGQEIFETETDKATVAVEATDAGRLAKIIAEAGSVIAIKQPVAYLSESEIKSSMVGAPAIAAAATAPKAIVAASVVTAPVTPPVITAAHSQVTSGLSGSSNLSNVGGIFKASPHARKMAKEAGLDLASVGQGSGPGGRILSTDLARAKALTATGASTKSSGKPAIAPVTVIKSSEIVRTKMSKMRKAIGLNLQMSKQSVPHFYLRGTIDAGPLMNFYKGEKSKYPCSVNDVVALACAKAIIEFPALRSKIDKDEMVEYPHVNIGVAVGVEDGLTVPVLLNAHVMNLQQIAANTRIVVESARAGKLIGYGQGNFTITNLGMFGVEEFSAIVNPPEPGILAVGAIREDVIVKDGAMRPGKVMTMTLSCDHRIVDGLLAAKFMARLKELLENPGVLG